MLRRMDSGLLCALMLPRWGLTKQRVFQNNYFALDFKTSFDIISLAMPPGLPAAMSIGNFLHIYLVDAMVDVLL